MASITIKTLLWASSSALALGLAGCGGDSSFIDKQNGSGSGSGSGSDSTDNSALIAARAGFDDLIASLQVEGGYLFGDYDATDPATQKGVVDHGIDTFTQGPLQLGIEVKKSFDSLSNPYANPGNFTYRSNNCFVGDSDAINVGCFVISGENLKNVLPTLYDTWDFEISKSDMAGLRLTSAQLDQFFGNTYVYILENDNDDKDLNDVFVVGSFSYPYQQSWNLNQTNQKRFVTINAEGSNETVTYQNQLNDDDLFIFGGASNIVRSFDGTTNEVVITGTGPVNTEINAFESPDFENALGTATVDGTGTFEIRFTKEVTKGAFTVYDDPTSNNGKLYTMGNSVSMSVLINDNPNRPEPEIVDFSITSTPGDATSSSSYRVGTTGLKTLDLRNLTSLTGQRVENEEPDLNASSFSGSLRMSAIDIFQFSNQPNGSQLNFAYTLNGFDFTGTSTINGNKIDTSVVADLSGTPYRKSFSLDK